MPNAPDPLDIRSSALEQLQRVQLLRDIAKSIQDSHGVDSRAITFRLAMCALYPARAIVDHILAAAGRRSPDVERGVRSSLDENVRYLRFVCDVRESDALRHAIMPPAAPADPSSPATPRKLAAPVDGAASDRPLRQFEDRFWIEESQQWISLYEILSDYILDLGQWVSEYSEIVERSARGNAGDSGAVTPP